VHTPCRFAAPGKGMERLTQGEPYSRTQRQHPKVNATPVHHPEARRCPDSSQSAPPPPCCSRGFGSSSEGLATILVRPPLRGTGRRVVKVCSCMYMQSRASKTKRKRKYCWHLNCAGSGRKWLHKPTLPLLLTPCERNGSARWLELSGDRRELFSQFSAVCSEGLDLHFRACGCAKDRPSL
jgi:hypothetical protein